MAVSMKRCGMRFFAVLMVVALVFAAAVPGWAYASVTTATSSATVQTKASAKKTALSAGEKIAIAGAKISYSRLTLNKYGVGTKAYFKACKKLGSYYVHNQKQMQCNVPVAAAVRASGVDKKFPTTNQGMYSYMMKSKKWKRVGNYNGKTSSLKPGDVLIRIKGVTKYKKNGKTYKASSNHACLYVGSNIAKSVYKNYLKGTDADKGSPGSKRVFVNARKAESEPSQRRAACLETQSQAYADYKMIVFRYVG